MNIEALRKVRLSTAAAGGGGTAGVIVAGALAAFHVPFVIDFALAGASGVLLGIGYWRLWFAAKA